jgi:hypothetical protein
VARLSTLIFEEEQPNIFNVAVLEDQLQELQKEKLQLRSKVGSQ